MRLYSVLKVFPSSAHSCSNFNTNHSPFVNDSFQSMSSIHPCIVCDSKWFVYCDLFCSIFLHLRFLESFTFGNCFSASSNGINFIHELTSLMAIWISHERNTPTVEQLCRYARVLLISLFLNYLCSTAGKRMTQLNIVQVGIVHVSPIGFD